MVSCNDISSFILCRVSHFFLYLFSRLLSGFLQPPAPSKGGHCLLPFLKPHPNKTSLVPSNAATTWWLMRATPTWAHCQTPSISWPFFPLQVAPRPTHNSLNVVPTGRRTMRLVSFRAGSALGWIWPEIPLSVVPAKPQCQVESLCPL